MTRDPRDIIKLPNRLPVPDLSRIEEQTPPPALELVAHEASVSIGVIGGVACLVFDLMAPGLGSPMLIRVTVPIQNKLALQRIGEGCIAKAEELEKAANTIPRNDGPEDHHVA